MAPTRGVSVHELFEAQARRTPGATALVAPSAQEGPAGTVTYAELDHRAGSVAARLAASGVRPGDLVGVLCGRSVDMVVAILGVLKAGAAYVPLDPQYPEDRLAFMLADTRATVCLASAGQVERARAIGADQVLLPEAAPDLVPGPSVARPGDAPAYVMYTSGSTGRPKGVVVPHRGIVRLVVGADYARLDATRVVLHLAPTSFDAATFEVWGPLLNGARCVLVPDMGMPDLAAIRRIIAEHGVTTLWLTASLFNVIIDQAPELLRGVQEVLTGGETLSFPHVRKALDLLPDVQFVNGYGPTEATTFTCCYRIPRPLPAGLRSIPIGTPINRTSVVVLDDDLRPVADGEPGNLFIGGDGLALGYLHREELTAERFIPNPFGQNGDRLYRTGDRARVLPDGNLEFLGRLDDQVKIRGHRIELGEIEVLLRTAPRVGSAVVVLREDGPGGKQLVAYVTHRVGEAEPEPATLRGYLQARLPEYMVPSHVVVVPSIPLTASGKADRRALPSPPRNRPALNGVAVASRTPGEAWLAAFWREVLGLDEIGVHDRFFELGGTSIIGMQLIGRLSQATGVTLPALLLYRAPTVADMATVLEAEYPGVLPGAARGSESGVHPLAQRAAQRRDELRERRRRRRHGG